MSDNTNDGGPAFPKQPIFHYPHGATSVSEQGGMSLRDYFAAKAMQGLIGHMKPGGELQAMSKAAYGIADLMLIEREAKS